MNTKTITLTGEETAVKLDKAYPYIWVRNLGSGDVYMSLKPGIVPDADGVAVVPAGGGSCSGDVGQTNTLYLLGSGKIEVSPQFNAVCPFFKPAGKGGDKSGLITDGLVFSLTDIEFTDYTHRVSLGQPSAFNLPVGAKSAEVVTKCGTNSNWLFCYGSAENGKMFASNQVEFVGYSCNAEYAQIDEIKGKTRHIVFINENNSLVIYVNGVKVIDTALSYNIDPGNSFFNLNTFGNYTPTSGTSGAVQYALRFYNKRLSEAEILNNYNVFKQKYDLSYIPTPLEN